MINYVRLLRLPDQYLQVGSIIAAGIFLGDRSPAILWWLVATTLISFAAFIINELTDSGDTDVLSWNTAHMGKKHRWNKQIVLTLFMVFSLGGLVLSYALGLFWWGLAMYTGGVLYSLEPVRFKKRFGLDILTQLAVWWVIPFLALTWNSVDHSLLLAFTLPMICLVWSAFFPYQLADYPADVKAKLGNTHVLLGMDGSLALGKWLGVIGIVLFFLFGLHRWALWSIPLVGLAMYGLFGYRLWTRMDSLKGQVQSMQAYVRRAKPISRFLIPYFLLVWVL